MLYFIVNEKSKSGKRTSVWEKVEKYLKEKNIEYKYVKTKKPGHATILAEKISQKEGGMKKLIIIGGDGTINEVINGITDFEQVAIGVIPNGSGNDFARGLGIEKDLAKNLEGIISSEGNDKIDLGKVYWDSNKSKLYAISSGIGMDALVCKLAINSRVKKYMNKLGLGKITYLILTIKSLFTMETADVTIKLDGSEKKLNKLIFSAMMNFRAEGGGVPMSPNASAYDGMLSVCMAHGVSKWKTFLYLPILVAAKHERLKGMDIVAAKYIEWSSDREMTLHTDGEYCGEVKNARFECIKECLRILK